MDAKERAKFRKMARQRAEERVGKQVFKWLPEETRDDLVWAEAARLVLAQGMPEYGPAQELIRACVNDETTE